jgi:hypothetical protein
MGEEMVGAGIGAGKGGISVLPAALNSALRSDLDRAFIKTLFGRLPLSAEQGELSGTFASDAEAGVDGPAFVSAPAGTGSGGRGGASSAGKRMSLSDFFFLICGAPGFEVVDGGSSTNDDPFWREKTRERDLARFLCFGRGGGAVMSEPDEVRGGRLAGEGDV